MPPSDQSPSPQSKSHSFQVPKGTRDMYPADLLRRRYIEKMWRDTSIRHGFEEIDGPTFEHLDLYTVKSGEGIISELFSFRREGGEKDYALRPEFTPTLARMYAAKAGSLPKPTKWFWQQNCFRAERPQRGRLREFGQWNVDLIGGEETPESKAVVDADVIASCVDAIRATGLTPRDVRVRIGHRGIVEAEAQSVAALHHHALLEGRVWLTLLDQRGKMPRAAWIAEGKSLGISEESIVELERLLGLDNPVRVDYAKLDKDELANFFGAQLEPVIARLKKTVVAPLASDFRAFANELASRGVIEWCEPDLQIARGLAYYTGMVFEVHEAGGKERAIAGGGRYDKLIEMFGGPPTPAVGFGMGDVVLSLVLQDRGLHARRPSPPRQTLRAARLPPSRRLRYRQRERGFTGRASSARRPAPRGGPNQRPLHARHTYKATKNIGKILQEASSCHARFAAIIENGNEATLKNLATGEQQKLPLAELAARVSAS